MDLRLVRSDVVVARRHRLAALLRGIPALVPAGAPTPRNYAANTYEFRASSHFLYFVGLPIPGAMLLVDGDEPTIFMQYFFERVGRAWRIVSFDVTRSDGPRRVA